MGSESSKARSLLVLGSGICLVGMIGCGKSSPARGVGGSPGSGGSSVIGGSAQIGGSTTPGNAGRFVEAGRTGDGGATSDTDGHGGASGGGTTNSGRASGGTITGTGGSRPAGRAGVGGATAGAASTSSGGASASGGTTGKGGSPATGGTTGAGGSTTANGVPTLVSTIDLKGASGCPVLRLGDINGDGRMEIVMGQPADQASLGSYTPQVVVAVTAFDLKGKQLWQYGTRGQYRTASSDIPIQVYDMDGDGKAEVFANMSNTEMTVLDGATGKLLRKLKLPQAGANDCIAFANLRGKPWPQDIIVKTRYSQFWAITGEDGTMLWNHTMLAADSGMADLGTGHYPLVHDWNGDGKDEVMGGYDFLDSAGKKLWSVTNLKLHADAIATGDLDGDPSNGYEIIIGGDVASAFAWNTGEVLWKDSNTTECQQLGLGDYRTDLPGLEVALLDRMNRGSPPNKDGNVLLDAKDHLLWKESRPDNSGWLSVTENLHNWDGKQTDLIFTYRRGSGGAYLYDGYGKTIARFPYPGSDAQSFAQHADLCGDGKEEVIVYDESTLWIYANGGCDLDAAPPAAPLPQRYHLYNWSIYTGWITPDLTFTPQP